MLNTIPKRGQHTQSLYKWQDGKHVIMWARAGYGWVNGQYVPVKPGASGVTMRHHGMSRRERRWWDKTRRGQRRARYIESLED
jgi:hypothetical protein